jgi:DNA-binding transcriptional MerR regulator
MRTTQTYSLRQVVELTGLTEFTLRAWENRYGAFKPQRSTTQRRKYSNIDLQKAMLLRELTQRGHRIGDIAQLSPNKLNQILGNSPSQENIRTLSFHSKISKATQLLALQDWKALESLLLNTSEKLRSDQFILEFLVPLMKEIGILVSHKQVSIAQEHIISSFIKQILFSLKKPTMDKSSIKVVIAAPENDFHELGILMAHVLMDKYKINSLYLGPNTPKNSLCETVLRFGATYILIACTTSSQNGMKDELPSFIHFIDKNLPQNIKLLLAGREGQNFRGQLTRVFKVFQSMESLNFFLAKKIK